MINARFALSLIMLVLISGFLALGAIRGVLNPTAIPEEAAAEPAEAEADESAFYAEAPLALAPDGAVAPVLPPLTNIAMWNEAAAFQILYGLARGQCADGQFTTLAGPVTEDDSHEWQVVQAARHGMRVYILHSRAEALEFARREAEISAGDGPLNDCVCEPVRSDSQAPKTLACLPGSVVY